MNAAVFLTATGVAAAVAYRLTEISVCSLGMCAAIGLGMGICVLVLCKPDNLKGVA